MTGLARFNAMSGDDAERNLHACFASGAWARPVARGRPYEDLNALLAAAESAWAELAPRDWMKAIAAHPRIGERGGHSPAASVSEQSRVNQAAQQTLAALAADNRRYEARFGHTFLIAASGRSAEEILEELQRRMSNEPVAEAAVAAEELRKITRLRLEQMVRD